jgi:hypothetical protein
MRLNVIDHHFAHSTSLVAGVDSEFITWDRTLSGPTLGLVMSHEAMLEPVPDGLQPSNTFGLIVESQAIIPQLYRDVQPVMGRFDAVFTHSSKLLSGNDNAHWIPGGGIWVGGSFAGGRIGIAPKRELCSMLSSRKTACSLHRERLQIANRLWNKRNDVDVFIDPPGIYAYDVTRSYRYNICVENYIDESYFTERILNCFATGTIPIYKGATKIAGYFDIGGILEFDTFKDLELILRNISVADYDRRFESIQENFRRVMQYRSIEDYIFRNYLSGGFRF